jgi:hypothetical protein
MKRCVWVLFFAGCSGSGGIDSDPVDSDEPIETDEPVAATWRDGVGPLFDARCQPCHTGYDFGDIQVNRRADLVDVPSSIGMPLITPGSLEDSYVWRKVTETHLEVGGSGERMPLDVAPLDASEEGLLSEWILAGAPLQ